MKSSYANYTPNKSRLPKVLIPMIRKTFPELITSEIVGVQPMSGPVGLSFALRYNYESPKRMCIDKGTLQYNVLKDLLGVSPRLFSHPYLEGIFLDDDSWQLNSVFPKDNFNFERLTFWFNCKITPRIVSYAFMSPYYRARHNRKVESYEPARASAQGILLFKLPS